MHQRANPNPGLGDLLWDQAADMLSSQYGSAKTEFRADGKKVDVYFEQKVFGKTTKIFLEAKDYAKPLGRKDVVHIKADYEGILNKNAPAILLIVTRSGLTPDAQSYIDIENPACRHQTIWEIETGLIDFENYLRFLIDELAQTGLHEYYIKNGFSVRLSAAPEHKTHTQKTSECFDTGNSCFEELVSWSKNDNENTPVAVLGGYGTGKTSLATKLASHFSENALTDPYARQPIVLKLGGISQYANIEGLLGGYFTNDFPIKNFNCHNFLALNRKGRFIIILDGFDEMKHSMTWADFKAQVKNLLRLHGEKTKIILLGRPSAFLSEAEDRYILKGERPVGESWVRLPEWPRFHELELSDFTRPEREDFIAKYLNFASKQAVQLVSEGRAKLTNEIADNDPALFKKPVHSKILTDLATDPNFDLEQFRTGSSRWLLYQEFVNSLYNREMEKRTRSDISTERRLKFLADLAFWLWTEQGTQISFAVNQLPKRLFENINIEDSEDLQPICRELLTGSILERKSGDVFFFGHRSFAEFLVADRLLRIPPGPDDHSLYSGAFQDGVREFLVDAKRPEVLKDWSQSFGQATGIITQNYVDFLAEPHGGIKYFGDQILASSPWKLILKPFEMTLSPNKENFQRIFKALFTDQSSAFSWHYCWLTQFDNEAWNTAAKVQGRGIGAYDRNVFVCLLNALFGSLKKVDRNLFVDEAHVGLRRICHEGVKLYEFEGRAEFEWSHAKLAAACQRELQRSGLGWEIEMKLEERSVTTNIDEIFNQLNKVAQDNLLIFLKHVRSWSSITERGRDPGQRREISRKTRPANNLKLNRQRG